MNTSRQERPWLAAAAEWTSKITTLAGQMVLPVLAGLWLDRVVGTVWIFLVLGAALGFTSGMYQLVLWVRAGVREPPRSTANQQTKSPPSPTPPSLPTHLGP